LTAASAIYGHPTVRQDTGSTRTTFGDDFAATMMTPVRWLDPVEMSNAVL
jgi:hypothetical protein